MTEIGDSAFWLVSSLRTLEFEAGSMLQTIRGFAFYETRLTAITLPKSIWDGGFFFFSIQTTANRLVDKDLFCFGLGRCKSVWYRCSKISVNSQTKPILVVKEE